MMGTRIKLDAQGAEDAGEKGSQQFVGRLV